MKSIEMHLHSIVPLNAMLCILYQCAAFVSISFLLPFYIRTHSFGTFKRGIFSYNYTNRSIQRINNKLWLRQKCSISISIFEHCNPFFLEGDRFVHFIFHSLIHWMGCLRFSDTSSSTAVQLLQLTMFHTLPFPHFWCLLFVSFIF